MDRQQEYRNRDAAIEMAAKFNGEFVDREFKDLLGSYWVVIFRREYR